MAVYGQLLIDAGGGVIDRTKQSEKQDGASLIIGLGGTGTDAVMKVKREMYKQLKPDDEDSVIPRYDSIRYLVIDSDTTKLQKQSGTLSDVDKNNEFFDVSNSSIKSTFAAHKVLEGRKELSWLDHENITPDDASAGAGGIRQVGRFLLVDKAQQLYSKIKTEMMNALRNAASGKLNVHICAGISGGTGSGTFVDICYLVREALNEIGKPNSQVCGYFFLPDVNLSVPEVSANPLLSEYIKVNGYAALQELDYCMNLGKNKDRFEMNYGFKSVSFETKPVDLCYLISTTNSSGNVIKNGYQYAMGVVADYIISFLAKVQLPPGVEAGTDSGLTLEGHISNLKQMKDGIKLQHGAAIDYNILGAAIAEMPLSEIATYLGAKLFEAYRDIYDKAPFEKDVKDFLMRSQLQYEDIRAGLINGCAPKIQWGKQFDAELYKNTGNRKFIERADEFFNANKGIVVKNKTTMAEKLGDIDISRTGTSMISRVFKNLFDHYVTKLEYGPFYAKRMIFGHNNPNILHEVDGMIARCSEDLEAEVRQDPLRKQDLEEAKDRMDSANLINRSARIEDYKEALNNWYVHLYRIEVIRTLGDMLQEFKKQLSDLDHNLFSVLTTVLDTLRNTFEENANVLSEGVKDDNSYTWKILSIPDIQEGLDEVIKKTDVSQTLYDLMTSMFENCKLWIGEDQAEIVKLVSAFVIKEFEDATKKTMTDYLKEKYGVDNPVQLADAIKDDIIQDKLWNKSTPLFWQNDMYKNPVGILTTLTVPYDAAEIKQAATNYKGNQAEITIRESGITDKMSMMRFYSGLPLYAYQGIQELEDAYEKDNKPGRHLYERGEKNWNKILPSPIPSSFETGLPKERIANKNKALVAEFEEAEKKGIVVKDEFNHWSIRQTSKVDFGSIEEEIKKLGSDVKAIKGYIEKLEETKENLNKDVKEIRIEATNSKDGAERQVMLDFYLLSPVLNETLRDELTKAEKISEITTGLQQKIDSAVAGNNEIKEFYNAIFSGIITYGKKIVYSYDEFGIEKSIELQNLDMEYGESGAYQALLTYKDLDQKIKDRIVKDTKARMQEDDSEDLKINVAMLDEVMPKRIAGYMNIYENHPKHDDIEEFYTSFMKNFESFKQLNM